MVSHLRGRKSSILVKIICMHIKIYLLTAFFLCKVSFAQQTESTSLGLECVAFYNLENLFDTIVDPDTNKILQEDFTPHGPKISTQKDIDISLKIWLMLSVKLARK